MDIVDLIGTYVTLRKAGINYKGLCPFHEEKTPSFTVHPGKQIFKCFGCGAGGDVFTFLQLREKVGFVEARAMLAERAGIALDEERGRGTSGPGKADLARVNRWAADVFRRQFLGPAGAAARAYAEGRRISTEMSQAFLVGFAPDGYDGLLRAARQAKVPEALLLAAGLVKRGQNGGAYDTFRNRLMFPIVDASDRIIGFGGRALGDDPAKYLNTPENMLFEKGRHVFGLNRARDAIGRKGRAVVVEGYMDCLMAHQHGFDETVATLGTAFTVEQAQLLRRYSDSVILVFDSDEAGVRAADRALSVSLLQNLDVRLARVPTGKDPCDYLLSAGSEDFTTLLKGAPSAIEFRWEQVVSRFEGAPTGPARRRAIDEFLDQLAAWVRAGAVDVIQRGLLVNQVAKLVALTPAEVHARLGVTERKVSRPSAPALAPATRVNLADATDATEKAIRELTEVLICEPQFVDQTQEALTKHPSADPVMARVVQEVLAWCRDEPESGEWELTELIRRFEEPDFGRIITDLQRRGEGRGNFAATVAGALLRIQEADRTRQTTEAARKARGEPDRAAQDRALAAVQEGGRSHRHFAPLSAIRRPS